MFDTKAGARSGPQSAATRLDRAQAAVTSAQRGLLEAILACEGAELWEGDGFGSLPRWLRRQLLFRDRGCLFPGCGARRVLHCHHIEHWIRGGRTDLDNLGLLCSFHHRLVHEYGWDLELGPPGTAIWYRPDGSRYRLGPGSDVPDPSSKHAGPPGREPSAVLR